ncbi:hypothetical protein C8Q74DRAFT_1247749 [Fomes fomentarius]|nr:hypothetical protein C8Q74DRAFT_1247749 [Fomes fomentarius]
MPKAATRSQAYDQLPDPAPSRRTRLPGAAPSLKHRLTYLTVPPGASSTQAQPNVLASKTKRSKGKVSATMQTQDSDSATVEQPATSRNASLASSSHIPLAPAPPLTNATTTGQGKWEVKEDNLTTEHDKKPWQSFKSRIDFEFAEFALHAGLNHGQLSVLLDIVQRVAANPKDLTFGSASEVQAAWETAKHKQPTVCVIYLYPSSS